VEPERLAQHLEVIRVRTVEIEPENPPPASSSATASRLKLTSLLPRSWLTWQTDEPLRGKDAGRPFDPAAASVARRKPLVEPSATDRTRHGYAERGVCRPLSDARQSTILPSSAAPDQGARVNARSGLFAEGGSFRGAGFLLAPREPFATPMI
jgi:hypothetical protein